MIKNHRDAKALAEALGFAFLGTERGRGEHTKLVLRCPDGRRIRQPIPHDMGTVRHWQNFKAQLRRRLTP